MMMMVLCPKAGSLAFTPPPGDEMSEVVSRCLPNRQLWVSNLYKVTKQWIEVDSNLRLSIFKAQNIPLHHHIPSHAYMHTHTQTHTHAHSSSVESCRYGISAF